MSVRVFRIENWLKSIKVDTKNMSKKKKNKQKLKKEAEDEAKARDEAEAKYGSQMEIEMESEEITDVDLMRLTQKNEKTETHDHDKTYDKTLENDKFLENEKMNDISHEHEDSVGKNEETQKKEMLKKALNESRLAIQNDIDRGNPINEQQFMKVFYLSILKDI